MYNSFRKIFHIKLKETVEECMRGFNVSTVNDVIDARKRKFLAKYSVSENSLCQVFAHVGLCDTHYVMPLLSEVFFFSVSVSVLYQFGEIKLCVINYCLRLPFVETMYIKYYPAHYRNYLIRSHKNDRSTMICTHGNWSSRKEVLQQIPGSVHYTQMNYENN